MKTKDFCREEAQEAQKGGIQPRMDANERESGGTGLATTEITEVTESC